MRRERGLRVEAIGLALKRQTRLAERVDGGDQARRRASAEIIEVAERSMAR